MSRMGNGRGLETRLHWAPQFSFVRITSLDNRGQRSALLHFSSTLVVTMIRQG
jgi:hypothetical protein